MKSRLSKKDKEELLADKEYWDEFGKLSGWPLYGWTRREGASFLTPSQWGGDNKEILNLTSVQRDTLVDLLRKATNV